MGISEKTITIHNLPVHYWEAGEGNGRAVLLLHGALGDAELHWKEALLPLAERYHVFALDFPGYGGTAAIPDMSVSVLVEWLREFFNVLNLDQAVVIGNSIGAVPARLFAAAYPTCAPALIMVNGGALPRVPAWMNVLARIPGINQLLFSFFSRSMVSRDSLERTIYVKDVLTDEFVQRVQASKRSGSSLMRAMLFYPLPKECTPRVSTLLLWGSNDAMTPLEDAEALKKEIPGAKLAAVADCGSMPQLEATDVFVYQVNYFLDRISRPPKADLPGVGMLKPK